MMVRVLVTGGTGFVGKWLQCGIGTHYPAWYMSRSEYEIGDWDTVLDWTHIVHFAPIAPTDVIAHAKRCNARLLYASSGIVYHPENNTEYRQNKIKWEQECLDSGVDVVIARLFTFSGDGLDDSKAIVQFEKASRANETIRIRGNGQAIRSYMHGSEMARWLWAVLMCGKCGEAYDVGGDRAITILELAQMIAENNNSTSEIVVENSTPDPMPVYLPPDTAKTKALLK